MPPSSIAVYYLGGDAMNRDAPKVIRHLVALTGVDPCQTRIPRAKHWLKVHIQRVGDVRLITVVPSRGHCLFNDN